MAKLTDISSGDKNKKKSKSPKIKLDKEQSRFLDQLTSLEQRISYCRDFINLWIQYFKFLQPDTFQKDVGTEGEKALLTMNTKIARRHFEFCELMGDTFSDGKDIIKVLCSAVSLEHIRNMNYDAQDKLQKDWHNVLLAMNNGLGKLVRALPGNMPLAMALEFLEWDSKQPKDEEKPIPLEKRIKTFKQLKREQQDKDPAAAADKPSKKNKKKEASEAGAR